MYHNMNKKLIISIAIIIVSNICVSAQNKTILITESALPYTGQSWFYCGAGNALDGSKIKSKWDEGKRITSVAYTYNGWFVTMANDTGISEQEYKLSETWPKEWINTEWEKDYYISSIGYSSSQWLVVMSKGTGYTDQSWSRNSWDKLREWILEKRDAGFFITDLAFNGTYWTVVVSKTPKINTQGFMFVDNDNLSSWVKSDVYGNGYRVHLMEYGDGEYLVVYGNYTENNSRQQSFNVNPSDVSSFIQGKWDDSQHIAYLGGGYPQNTTNQNLASNTTKTTTTNTNTNRNTNNNSAVIPSNYLVSHDGMYGKLRYGTLYYLSDQNRIVSLNFKDKDGVYTLEDPKVGGIDVTKLMKNIAYELSETTGSEFIFYPYQYDLVIPSYNEMQRMMATTGTVNVNQKKTRQNGEIRVSKDWSTVNVNGTILTSEMTKEYYDKAQAAWHDLVIKGIAAGIVSPPDQYYHSEVEDQLKAEIEESQRKIDAIDHKQTELYQKRDDMNRGHTVIRYKSTNTASTPTVWCPICNRYDKPHDHVVNDGRH